MRVRLPRSFAWYSVAACAAIVAGCSGGGGGGSSFPGPAPAPSVATAPVTFAITVGSATAKLRSTRRPAYISAATKSVAITPIALGSVTETTTVVEIAPNASGCTGSGASLTCSATVTAPVGMTSFSVTTYDAANGRGAVLSAGTITVAVSASSNTVAVDNKQSLTLNAVPSRFVLTAAPASIAVGVPSSLKVSATVYDAAGSIVIGAGAFTQAIDLETIAPLGTDPVLHGPIVTTVPGCAYPRSSAQSCFIVSAFEGPSAPITLTYAGEFVAGASILLVAESPGLPSATLTVPFKTVSSGCTGSPIVVCPALLTFADPASSPIPLTVSEPGVTSFEADARNCKDTGAGQIADVNFKDIAFGDAFIVYPLNTAGSCTITISDNAQPPNQTVINVTLVSAATPSPSPSPTSAPSPTPLPSGPIAITPSNTLEFASSTAAAQTITASQAGFTSFTIDQKACAGVATVSPSSGTKFDVKPVAALTQGGTCVFSVGDSGGQSSPVTVYVDGTIFHVH